MKARRTTDRAAPWHLIPALLLVVTVAVVGAVPKAMAQASSWLEDGFVQPPDQTKPWCYWYWISDNLSREGITRDLEAMARVGIGEALIGNIFLDDVPAGDVQVLTPAWWELVEHAIREGARTGVNIGLFNCPGWSQSGGPWIQSDQAMRYLASAEIRVRGPVSLEAKLPAPKAPFQDVAVLAFPAPSQDTDSLATWSPRLICTPATAGADGLVDGDLGTSVRFPEGAGRGTNAFTVELAVEMPVTVRSIHLHPSAAAFGAQVEFQAADGQGRFAAVREFTYDRSNQSTGVGFMPRGPVTVAVPETRSTTFRLVFTGVFGNPAELAEIELSGAARLESYVEKQLGKMHPTPLPMWDAYVWRTQAEPDSSGLVVPSRAVRNVSDSLSADGTLSWDVPPGDWIIERVGMTPTGMRNSPASPQGQGLEVDKMNRRLAQHHFDAFIGDVLRRVPPPARTSFKRVVADSYEMGSQNWTDGFGEQFRQRYGYDPLPWLPVLSGRLVGSADQSERFLWDLRRLVADRVATDYVGGLRDACRTHGLGLWLENYGHWGFPSEFLKYGAASDRIGGEYWVTGDLGSIECRAASSCANTYGKPFVSAEAFTGGPPFQNAPAALKARGDWSFCEGVNHLVLHVYIHQPWQDKVPGVNAWFGTEFNRHNTWFAHGKAWVDYLRRCCWLLQQGTRVADVAYFIGEDAPKMTGLRQPDLPAGRDFDYINAEVVENSLGVERGVLALPHGTTYRVLVLPELDTMRPRVLRKVRELVHAGATVCGTPPVRSPSLEDFPQGDREVRALAEELWGKGDFSQPGEHRFGAGRVVWGKPLGTILAALDCPPDFESTARLRFTHRRRGDTDIYFVANPKAEALTTTAAFRAGGRAPELWRPNSGRIEHPAVYDTAGGVVTVPLTFGPFGSVFVVFRDNAAAEPERIVSVRRNGEEILGTRIATEPVPADRDAVNDFTLAAWIKPEDETTLVREANGGIVGLSEKRNDVLRAPHGDTYGGSGHAGCGLAMGTNGVCVFEHGANYFAPTLVHAVHISDWTHVAVVYRAGRPSLYLNGELVRSGLQSRHTVHSGVVSGGAAGFRGRAGGFRQATRALLDTEVHEMARTMPRPDRAIAEPSIQVTRRGDTCWARVVAAGDFELTFANGRQHRMHVPDLPPIRTLTGPWEVCFSPDGGAPAQTTFEDLVSWTRHPLPAVRYYSGKAVYRQSFFLDEDPDSHPGLCLILDLGEVRDLAVVHVNGRDLGTLWLPPWRLDITDALQAGANQLEVEVVNTWNNRLVGDAALPMDQRRTFLLGPAVSRDAPLQPAGLLGPVTIQSVAEVPVQTR